MSESTEHTPSAPGTTDENDPTTPAGGTGPDEADGRGVGSQPGTGSDGSGDGEERFDAG